jgi:hypothetical protein
MNLFKHLISQDRSIDAEGRTAWAGPPEADLQPFLYAIIGEEQSGMQLSVLSALARQDLDPWQKARDWSKASKGVAVRELSSLIAALPEAPTHRPRPEEIAARLIALLPPGGASGSRGDGGLGAGAKAENHPFLHCLRNHGPLDHRRPATGLHGKRQSRVRVCQLCCVERCKFVRPVMPLSFVGSLAEQHALGP